MLTNNPNVKNATSSSGSVLLTKTVKFDIIVLPLWRVSESIHGRKGVTTTQTQNRAENRIS